MIYLYLLDSIEFFMACSLIQNYEINTDCCQFWSCLLLDNMFREKITLLHRQVMRILVLMDWSVVIAVWFSFELEAPSPIFVILSLFCFRTWRIQSSRQTCDSSGQRTRDWLDITVYLPITVIT